jgi:hypothetical protein
MPSLNSILQFSSTVAQLFFNPNSIHPISCHQSAAISRPFTQDKASPPNVLSKPETANLGSTYITLQCNHLYQVSSSFRFLFLLLLALDSCKPEPQSKEETNDPKFSSAPVDSRLLAFHRRSFSKNRSEPLVSIQMSPHRNDVPQNYRSLKEENQD